MKHLTSYCCKPLVLVVGLWLTCFSQADASAMPHIHTWKTAAGVPVYFVRRTEVPMLDINVVFDAGSARDADYWGLSFLTSQSLGQGTQSLSVDEVASQFDELGASYGAKSSRDMTLVRLRTLTQQAILKPSLQLFHQVLTQPSFADKTVLHTQKQMLTLLRYSEQNPMDVAQKAFFKDLYPKYPYGHNVLGTTDSIKDLSVKQVKDFYRTYYVANNAKIIVVGDLTVIQAKQLSENLLKGLSPGHSARALPRPTPLTKSMNKSIAFKSHQSTIILGQLGMTRQDPDYFALVLGNHILGGMPLTSILFDTIRNKYGLAYSVSSYFLPLQQTGPFVVVLQTKASNTKKATQLTEKFLSDFVKNGVTQQQLQAAKANLTGSFPIAISSNEDLIAVVTRIAFYNRPRDYLDTFSHNINAVSSKDIQKAFQRVISMNQLLVVTVGSDAANAS